MTMLDPKGIEAACAATVLGEDEYEKPVHLEPREAETAIRAYLSTVTPAEVGGLVAELRNPDFRGSMQHLRSAGEIDRLFQQAATALEAKEAELAAVKAERDEHKRLKNALVLKAYPAMDGADDLVEALRRYGFPVSDAAEPTLMEGGSREALALHKAAKAFIAARRALTGGQEDG